MSSRTAQAGATQALQTIKLISLSYKYKRQPLPSWYLAQLVSGNQREGDFGSLAQEGGEDIVPGATPHRGLKTKHREAEASLNSK